jgi:hypothetical protein
MTVRYSLIAIMLALCCSVGVPVASAAATSDELKAAVGTYLQIQKQLAADTIDGVKEAATTLAGQSQKLGEAGSAVAKAAKSLGEAGDLKAAREAFGPLSEAMVSAAKVEGWKDLSDVKLMYCPMVKRQWLQTDSTIRNPYFGKSMLSCGEIKKP